MTTPKRCVFCLMTVGVLNCAQKTLMPRTISSIVVDGVVLLNFMHFKPGLHLEPSPASTPLARSSTLRSALGVMMLGTLENSAHDAFIRASIDGGAAEAYKARRARIVPIMCFIFIFQKDTRYM